MIMTTIKNFLIVVADLELDGNSVVKDFLTTAAGGLILTTGMRRKNISRVKILPDLKAQ